MPTHDDMPSSTACRKAGGLHPFVCADAATVHDHVSETGGSNQEDRLDHLRENELAAFLDGGLTADERRRVEAHIDVCDVCRAELVDIGRAVDNRRARGHGTTPLSRRWWAPAAAAAGILAIFFVPRLAIRSARVDRQIQATRIVDGEGERRIELISPADDVTVPSTHMAFAWHAVPADIYRISLLNGSGAPIWTTETTDTIAVLSPTVGLHPGEAYFLRVDAVANGIVATTGVHRLQVAR